MTADELLLFYKKYYKDGVTFKEIFGEIYDFNTLIKRYTTTEIACKIQEWKEKNEIA